MRPFLVRGQNGGKDGEKGGDAVVRGSGTYVSAPVLRFTICSRSHPIIGNLQSAV